MPDENAAAQPRVLLVWGQYPRWIPPITFSARQITFATSLKPGLQDQDHHSFDYFPAIDPEGWLTSGLFDLAELCERHGLGLDFDLVIVFAEQDMGVFPHNLAAFSCPKILLLGDTHHFDRPISTMITYARSERFDWVVAQFAAHHLHWFIKAGLANCAWVPGLVVREIAQPWISHRLDLVTMIGHTWPYHRQRHMLIEEMRSRSIPLAITTGTREDAARRYAESLISFNCSLNADVNLRTLEVVSAGGFLLTDRLPRMSGLSHLLPEGLACDTYGGIEELLDKIAFYRHHPEAALRIARAGQAMYRSRLTPIHALRRFMQLCSGTQVATDALPPDHRCLERTGDSLDRRISSYEDIQERHRTLPAVRVVLPANAHWFVPSDISDLPRVSIHRVPGATSAVELHALTSNAGPLDYVVVP